MHHHRSPGIDCELQCRRAGIYPHLSKLSRFWVHVENRNRLGFTDGVADRRYELGSHADAGRDGHQDMEHDRQHDQIHDRDAGGRQDDAAREQDVYETPFMRVEPRGDEQPCLHDYPWNREHDREDDAQLDLHQQELGRAQNLDLLRETALPLDGLERFQEELDETVAEHEENHGQWQGDKECVDQPLAEILQMVTEGHGV